MLRRITLMGVLILVLMVISAPTTHADMGPKPYATVDVVGQRGSYDLDILIKISHEVSAVEDLENYYRIDQHYAGSEYPSVLNGYQDTEGYASMTLYSGPPRYTDRDYNSFHLGYFGAPQHFKIALVFDGDVIITSEAVDRRMFNAHFIYDVSDVDLTHSQEGVGEVSESIPRAQMTTDFFIRLVLTVALELGVLALFGYRHLKSFLLGGGVNLVSQSILSILMVIAYYFWGGMLAAILTLALGEMIVIVSEIIIYGKFLKEHGRLRAVLYGLCANAASLAFGFFLLSVGQ